MLSSINVKDLIKLNELIEGCKRMKITYPSCVRNVCVRQGKKRKERAEGASKCKQTTRRPRRFEVRSVHGVSGEIQISQ